ncbi:MAG: pyridoxamine 5'-phosphate oxidase family protein, partial [Bacillota bacterium]|nr:pyridoxamine 5'-phosphate oxidase family protein [Bacillota bacterium]
VNYALYNEKIYIHCAKTGHKIDAIKKDPRVSFCVVAKDDIVPDKFATDYASVVVFAKARIIGDEELVIKALEAINAKYAPDYHDEGEAEIKKALKAVAVLELTPQHMTGKTAPSSIQAAAKKKN